MIYGAKLIIEHVLPLKKEISDLEASTIKEEASMWKAFMEKAYQGLMATYSIYMGIKWLHCKNK